MERIVLFPDQQMSKKEARAVFCRIGFASFSLSVIPTLFQLILLTLQRQLFPSFVWGHTSLHLLSNASIYLGAVPVCFLILHPLPQKDPLRERVRPLHWLGLLCVSVACIHLGSIVSSYVTQYLGAILGTPPANPLENSLGEGSLWSNLFFVGILAPILEELFFRRFLCRRLLFLGEGYAIFVSAAIFALCHGNFYQLFYAFATGAIFAFVYVKSGRLLYTVAIHMFINIMSGVLVSELNRRIDFSLFNAFASGEAGIDALGSSLFPLLGLLCYSVLNLILVIFGILLFCLHIRRIRFLPGEKALPYGQKLSCIFGNVGVILAIASFAFTFLLSILPMGSA